MQIFQSNLSCLLFWRPVTSSERFVPSPKPQRSVWSSQIQMSKRGRPDSVVWSRAGTASSSRSSTRRRRSRRARRPTGEPAAGQSLDVFLPQSFCRNKFREDVICLCCVDDTVLWVLLVSPPSENCLELKLRTAVCVAVARRRCARPSRCSSPCITPNRTLKVSLKDSLLCMCERLMYVWISWWQIKVLYLLTMFLFHFYWSEKTIKEYDFAEILKKSICLEQSTQAWCENCEKYQPTVSNSSGTPAAHINRHICS